MTTPMEALDAILEAVREVDGLTAEGADKLGQVALPVVLCGVPRLVWETSCPDPTGATFPVTLLVRLDSLAIETLLAFLPLVQAAIEDDTDGTVGEATPVSYDLGQGVTAAGYELTVEYPL